jgi:dihydrodipicolinate synthase/N-acetylneuraminate lyase
MTEPGAIRGVYNILPTPFDESGAVDEASLRRLVDFVIGTDVDGLTILGFLGEAAKLSEAERALVIDVSLEATAGRVPVIVGATAQATDPCVRHARDAVARGATTTPCVPTTSRWRAPWTYPSWCRTSPPARACSCRLPSSGHWRRRCRPAAG